MGVLQALILLVAISVNLSFASNPADTCASKCGSCSELTVTTGSGVGAPATNPPITQTLGTDASGCATLTISCAAPTGPFPLSLLLSENDVGAVIAGDGAPGPVITRTLVCNSEGQLVYTTTTDQRQVIVNQVECILPEPLPPAPAP